MTTDPITSWQIDGKNVGTVADFIFLGSKIIADSHCSHEINRRLLLERKAMTNVDRSLKKKKKAEVSLPHKGPYNQSYSFSSSHVQM